MIDTPKWYDTHLPKFQEIAYVKSMDEYQDLYKRSLEDPDGFWSEQARKYLSWQKEWDFVLDISLKAGYLCARSTPGFTER